MAKLVDALGSGPSRGNSVDVRVILAAILLQNQDTPMTTAAIIANGTIDNYERILPKIKKHSYIVAVDGGIKHCHSMHLKPDLIIGDMDSAPKEILKHYEGVTTKVYPVNKDQTDLELAVMEVLTQNFESATLFGALGGRLDHTLSNLNLLNLDPRKLTIVSETEKIFVLQGNMTISTFPGQTVSLFPFNLPCEGVTTQGLKWELNNATLNSERISISNVCEGSSFAINIKNGAALCFLVEEDTFLLQY